jgi:hypothetical protein
VFAGSGDRGGSPGWAWWLSARAVPGQALAGSARILVKPVM